jgi:hypothetical protein
MWLRVVLAVLLCCVAGVIAGSVAATSTTQFQGMLADGGTWLADVPPNWNGTLLLFSHGFGPPIVQEPLAGPAQDALLARGYALAGSSYEPTGSWWALKSAVRDQFETIGAVTSNALPRKPDRVLAVGISMGGLISALEAQQGAGRIDGALSTCGLVAGAIQLNNYQLDAEYTIAKLLLPPEQAPKLVNFASPDEGAATGAALTAAVQQAQTTPEGRARLALVFAFLNEPASAPGLPTPPANDPAAFEAAQYAGAVTAFPILNFIEFGRPWIEQSAGGNGSWTLGEDFAALLHHSSYRDVVEALYRDAGLDLEADLAALTAGANIPADPTAIASLQRTSVPTGHLQVPELTLHTVGDPLVPVQHESEYASLVRAAGDTSLLRQAFVDRWGHCTFTAAELVAGVETIRHRVETGRWDSSAEPQKLQELATSLGLGEAAFIHYQPPALSGNNGSFDPKRNALGGR